MLKFSIRDMLISMCFFAIAGSAMWAITRWQPKPGGPVGSGTVLIVWFSVGSFLGAAIGSLFKAPLLGLIVGLLLQLFLTFALLPTVY
jgi:hypothetical protein